MGTQGKRIPPGEIELMIRLRVEGMPVREIARELGRDKATVIRRAPWSIVAERIRQKNQSAR